MRNTSEYNVSINNKARLSTMTAFSFGRHLDHLKKDHLIPLNKAYITVFCVRFTSQNETTKSSLNPKIKTPWIVLSSHGSPEGGIVLVRLLVAV